ncbi:hypothetical protein LCGC14_0205250 [marine sediment metagenome]|uniref:Flagellar P-ring protein n=1 Tax=marine sediment metagenome TaxID=412755 RepID=A0A0F9UZ50_9ZZZZ
MGNGFAVRVIVILVLAGGLAGCEPFALNPSDKDKAKEQAEPPKLPLHIAGTLGEYAALGGRSRLPVQGYGLVVGLGGNGSKEIPQHVRRYLIQYLLKNRERFRGWGLAEVAPSRVLQDLDTAVVRVRGSIPPAASQDSRFDVMVTALSATGTRSLDGGILVPTEMHLDVGNMQPGQGSKIWAIAGGPVMVNPFIDPTDRQQAAKLRQAVIVGGGVTSRRRKVSLQLYRADFARSDQIQHLINARFPGVDRVARAKNASVTELTIPREVGGDQAHFLALVMHLPMRTGPRAWEVHARKLLAEMQKPDAAHESLAMVLEAHGRKVLPVLGALYDAPVAPAAFYAARTGVRLGDRLADDTIRRFAGSQGDPLQLAAIEVMGDIKGIVRADLTLRELLDRDNDMVRVAAYRALTRRRSASVLTISVDGQFHVDIVPSSRRPMIFATRTQDPRIVLFGDDLAIARPVFFNMPDDLVTVNAREGSDALDVWRRLPGSDRISDTLKVSFELAELIQTLGGKPQRGIDRKVHALGLTYGQIVAVLYRLCEQGHVPAKFILEPAPAEHELLKRIKEAETYNMSGT